MKGLTQGEPREGKVLSVASRTGKKISDFIRSTRNIGRNAFMNSELVSPLLNDIFFGISIIEGLLWFVIFRVFLINSASNHLRANNLSVRLWKRLTLTLRLNLHLGVLNHCFLGIRLLRIGVNELFQRFQGFGLAFELERLRSRPALK